MAADAEAPAPTRIWDLPTRLLKWATAVVVFAAWMLGANMTFTNVETHFLLGYGALGLLVARLLWGFVGAPASRFSTMLRDLRALPGYALRLFKPEPSYWPGHNPMGTLWLLAFWSALAVQTGTGLFAYTDAYFAGGPLTDVVSRDLRDRLTAVHIGCARAILILVGMHLAAVFFYAVWKSENLIGPMISGWKAARARSADGRAPRP